MYRIKIGNMYLSCIILGDNARATLNDFIDYIEIDSNEAKLYEDELAANKVADKLYVVLGVRPIVEKVGDKDE